MVLFLAIDDWANVAYSLAESLKSIGKPALALTKKKHSFHYPKEAKVYSTPRELKKAAKKADTIIWMHSKVTKVPTSGKKLLVFHGGSIYRRNPGKINRIFNPLVHASLIQTGDLLSLGAKNEIWLQALVDTATIQPNFEKVSELKTIAHFPAIQRTKGTPKVYQVIEELKKSSVLKDKFRFISSGKNVSWKENIERMSKCDIYIDALQPELKGKKYGEWGIAALEAAALGKIVVSHFLSYERYLKEFGNCAIKHANSVEELEKVLRNLIQMNDDQMKEEKVGTREWVEKKHSLEVIGERLLDIINRIQL